MNVTKEDRDIVEKLKGNKNGNLNINPNINVNSVLEESVI